jgi:perosamine synthetase
MNIDVNPTIVARDQFLSWTMMSARQSDWIKSTKGVSRYSFFQARNAIYHSLDLLGIERGSHILVPSYICRAAIDPLIASGLDVGFYQVTRDCAVDRRDLEAKITGSTRAVLIVHYFGFPQPVRRLKRLCDTHGLALIEDCAHVLSGEVEGEAMGTVGDAAVFSWRKFLPVYDGAELVINRSGRRKEPRWTKESPLFTLKVAANMMEASLARTRQPLLRLSYQGIRAGEAIFRKCANSYLKQSPMMRAETSAASFDMQSINWPMSRLSRWTMTHSSIASIIARRRRNYEILRDELSSLTQVRPLFSELPATVCPWVFPVILDDVPDAHLLLRRLGIPAVTWEGVRHSLVDSDFLYRNLVFLPVHQSLQDRDIMTVAHTVKVLYERMRMQARREA